MGANINFKTVEDKLTAFALNEFFTDGSLRLLVSIISKRKFDKMRNTREFHCKMDVAGPHYNTIRLNGGKALRELK